MSKKFKQLVNEIAPISPADKDFWKMHKVEVIADRNGNGDEVFKGTVKKDSTRKADKTAPEAGDPPSLPINKA